MDFFSRFTSNTIAGSANQHTFRPDGQRTGRVYYKIAHGGTYQYSLLFSNIVDSTYSDGSVSYRNLICPAWRIHEARVGRCLTAQPDHQPLPVRLTFDGRAEKDVHPGEFFHTDPVTLTFEAGEYLCLEMTFSGELLPYHEESLLPVFSLHNGEWVYDKHMPLPGMVGCDRPVKTRVAFVGDSITQGIGTDINSYQHWNAVTAARLPESCACWNLGIGYARANDLATCSAWMYKLRHNDVYVVCMGVNDIWHEASGQLQRDLSRIVDTLRAAGGKIVLQTIPPFHYPDEKKALWQNANRFIREELAKKVDLVFDVAPLLAQDEEHPQNARYGGHPDAAGCAVWGEALYEAIRDAGIVGE